jgi:serine/threonine protein kinase
MKPDRIGPYRILDTVAEDALTVTYRAEDPGLGRTLLLKTARGSAPAAVVRERLSREAKIRADLAHPAILTLYGIVRKDEATVLLLEDVRGPRLSEVMARLGRLDVAQAVAIAASIAGAIAVVHQRGVVHAGLRPERFALVPGGLRLIDFSTAHPAGTSADDTEEEPQRLPEYMAPEQILSEEVGPRADVFSIGVLLFEMISGRRPFDGPAPKTPPRADALALAGASATAGHALAQRIRTAPPAPLVTSAGPPTEAVARIPTPAGSPRTSSTPCASSRPRRPPRSSRGPSRPPTSRPRRRPPPSASRPSSRPGGTRSAAC